MNWLLQSIIPTKHMKKYIFIAIMALGSIGTSSFAQQQLPTKGEEKDQKRADNKQRDINDARYKMDKKQDKKDKKVRKMHKKERKVDAQQRSVDRQSEAR
jgi:hypothetical protein